MNSLLSNLTVNILTYRTNQEILKNCILSIDKSVKINLIENSKKLENENYFKNLNRNINLIYTGKNLGYAGGHNIGLNYVKTKYALILNPDLICKEKYFEKIQKYLTEKIDFTIIGSQYEQDKMNKPAYGFFENDNYNDKVLIDDNNLQKVDWVVGCSMLINLEKFDNRNLFDESFFLFFEETDFCKRVKMNKGKIYSSKDLIIDHFGEQGSFATEKSIESEILYIKLRNWHLMWSSFYYYKKHNNYFFALVKSIGIFFRSLLKIIFYLLLFNKKERIKYLYRFLGLFNSMIGKKSWYRPK